MPKATGLQSLHRTPAVSAAVQVVTPSRRYSVNVSSAFTLIEAIVVIVLVSIIAGLVVPRMISTAPRAAQNEARALQRLLSIAAEKSALLAQPVAIEYESSEAKFIVLVQRARVDDAGQPLPPEWSADTLVDPVSLEYSELRDARAAGVVLDKTRWRVVFPPGQPRPDLILTLARKDAAEQQTRLTLMAHAAGAVRDDPQAPAKSGAGTLTAIDLDDAGRGTKPW